MGINMTNIFISYDRDDRPFIRQLARQLRRVYGYDGVWYDENIRGGEDWWNEIRHEIAKSDIFMFLLSAESAQSPYCQKELGEAKRLNKEVLPVRIEPLQDIPDNLRQIQYVDMSEGAITVENFTELNAAIKQISDKLSREERRKLEAAARSSGWLRWGILAVPLSIVVLLTSALIVSTPAPPFQGEITFTSGRSSDASLFNFQGGIPGTIGKFLGRNPHALTEQTSIESPPAYSPDGTRIAFAQRGDTGADLYVMNADGSNVQRLTDDGQNNHYPTWSPDGRQIAFARDAGQGNLDIFAIEVNFSDPANVAVSNLRNITNDPASDDYPSWSPDGAQLAFASTRGENGRWNIFVLNLGSGEVNPLTINNGDNTSPIWKPDQLQVAFESNRTRLGPASLISGTEASAANGQQATNWDVYVMDIDGSGVVPITKSPGTDRYPRWSPDGRQLIFTSDRDGDFDLYLVEVADRQNVDIVTNNVDNDVFATWK
jgi:Tol biopolymer transport system component